MNGYKLAILDNSMFNVIDGYTYYNMIKKHNPKKIIEAGCGYSSRIAIVAAPEAELTFIDVNLGRYLKVTKNLDLTDVNITTHTMKLEDVDKEIFKTLEPNDIFFIDTSHNGADVDFYIKEIFPILEPGVIVHIHDIYYDEWNYPEHVKKRGYNEQEKVRKCLDMFVVLRHTNGLSVREKEDILNILQIKECKLPLNQLGASLWLRKKGLWSKSMTTGLHPVSDGALPSRPTKNASVA